MDYYRNLNILTVYRMNRKNKVAFQCAERTVSSDHLYKESLIIGEHDSQVFSAKIASRYESRLPNVHLQFQNEVLAPYCGHLLCESGDSANYNVFV